MLQGERRGSARSARDRHPSRRLVACFLSLAACPSPSTAVCPPSASQPSTVAASDSAVASISASASIATTVPAPSGSSASPEVALAHASTRAGSLSIVRRIVNTHVIFFATWTSRGRTVDVQLDGLVDATATFALVDLDDDDIPEVIADLGATITKGPRFQLYLSTSDADRPVDGNVDSFAWRALEGVTSLDDATRVLRATPRFDFSVPEACGAIDRARKPIETWLWSDPSSTWTRTKRARMPGWSCGSLQPDGDAFWMPELRCDRFFPACEAMLLSGGHGGTALPHETYYFFARTKGRLDLVAIAENDH